MHHLKLKYFEVFTRKSNFIFITCSYQTRTDPLPTVYERSFIRAVETETTDPTTRVTHETRARDPQLRTCDHLLAVVNVVTPAAVTRAHVPGLGRRGQGLTRVGSLRLRLGNTTTDSPYNLEIIIISNIFLAIMISMC